MTPPRVRDEKGELTIMVGGPYDGVTMRIFETDRRLLTWEGLGGCYVAEEGVRKRKGSKTKASTTMVWDPKL